MTFYADATWKVAIDNTFVHAIAQCNLNINRNACVECLKLRSKALCDCLPATSGEATDTGCFMSYRHHDYSTYDSYGDIYRSSDLVLCDNKTLPQPPGFQKAAERLLLDLQIAAPRTINFYAASTRKVDIDNSTVYAIAQCNLNLSQGDCFECLRLRSEALYECLPATSGQATDVGCFMRYDNTPFFGQNQKTDIASLLRDDSSKKRHIIRVVVGGVSSLLLALAFSIWFCRWKKTAKGQQSKHGVTLDAPAELKGWLTTVTNIWS